MVRGRMMTNYIKFTPDLCYDWKQTALDVERYYPHQLKRTKDASTPSQLASKLWLVEVLLNMDLLVKPRIALVGGWFANYITPLLIDNLEASIVFNYEIDKEAKEISYKFNKRYKDSGKYQCSVKDVMMKTLEAEYDIIINTSCEHMYPMTKFYEWNPDIGDPLYVLQSTNDDQYDDHINCVGSPEELAEQAKIADVWYSGSRELPDGMTRFMVIGYPT